MLIQYQDLPKLRKKYQDKKIVYCSGTFDLTHAGHILFFEDCKKFGDLLVVGIGSDAEIKKNKGPDRPILNEDIRLKTILSLKPVDYCLLDRGTHKDKHWQVNHVLKHLRPDAYVVNTDAFDIPSRKKIAEKYGVPFKMLKRSCPPSFKNISSSGIIKKIKALSQV